MQHISYYTSSVSGRQPVKKWINNLDTKTKRDVESTIAGLVTQDFTSDNRLLKNIVHLRHPSRDHETVGVDLYEIRVSDKRVYFSKHEDELLVVGAGKSDESRGDVLKAFSRAQKYADGLAAAREAAANDVAVGGGVGRR
jgi:putative component of toxin-antitoxin plasmid stabilization module